MAPRDGGLAYAGGSRTCVMTGVAVEYTGQDRCPSVRPAVGGWCWWVLGVLGETVDDVLCEGADPDVLVIGGGPEDLERFIV